jgi:hypothetical protein
MKPFLQRLRAKEYAGSWKNPLFEDPKMRERSYERSRFVLYGLLTIASLSACTSLLFWLGTQERFALGDIRVEGMRSIQNTPCLPTIFCSLSLRMECATRTCHGVFAKKLHT